MVSGKTEGLSCLRRIWRRKELGGRSNCDERDESEALDMLSGREGRHLERD